MMGVSCMSVRQARGVCQCPACPRASGPPQTLVLPPMAMEPEITPVKDKKGSKMKVLKKIKKKIGLAPRTSCTGGAPNNLPPLGFHAVHGENVRVSRDGSTARRVESFCKGVVFSARPVRVNEKVCIRFVEISNSWSGVIRFGFTTHDPVTIAHPLPKYACPDLTNKPGNWAKALGERFCEKDNLLYYYVNSAGEVHFGVNGVEKGLFFAGVDTRSPLWALVDVYGNCTAVQFTDPRAPSIRRPSPEDDRLAASMRSLTVEEPLPTPRHQMPLAPLSLHRTKGRNVQMVTDRGVAARSETEFCQGYVFTARPMRPGQTIVVQILSTEAAYAGSLAIGLTSCDPATLRPCDLPDDAELLLDRPEYWVVRRDAANGLRRGDELAVTLTAEGEVRVSRNGSAPLTVMHVDHTLRLWAFVDIYGATQKVRLLSSQLSQSVSPAQVRVLAPGALPAGALPAGGGTLLVVSLPPAAGGQATLPSAHYIEPMQSPLCLNSIPYPRPTCSTRDQCSSNQNNQNEQLTPSERLPAPSTSRQCQSYQNQANQSQSHQIQSQNHQIQSQCHQSQSHQIQNQNHQIQNQNHQIQNQSHQIQSQNHQVQSQPHQSQSHQIQIQSHQIQSHQIQSQPHQSQSHQIQSQSHQNSCQSQIQPIYSVIGENLTGTECTICYENPIDSVLYMCGHMCMCYRCAVQQWRGKGGGQCPLCRAQIKDVIRTYKS